jgi:hypothetical protein
MSKIFNSILIYIYNFRTLGITLSNSKNVNPSIIEYLHMYYKSTSPKYIHTGRWDISHITKQEYINKKLISQMKIIVEFVTKNNILF